MSPDGSYTAKPDVAIVVFGEQPYAEMRGDVRTLEFEPGDKSSLALLKKLKAAGIPTVSVFLSGRPMWVNPELNQSDAFVAAWYPGTEGGGIADVLIGGKRDFSGKLAFSWPKTAGQFVLNRGAAGYDPLFAFGYGLSYAKGGTVPALSEIAGIEASLSNTSLYFARGRVPAPFRIELDPAVTRSAVDSAAAQEGAIQLAWNAAGSARILGPDLELVRETNGDLNLQLTYRLDKAPTGAVALSLGGGQVDITTLLDTTPGWHMLRVPLKCFRDRGATVDKVSSPFSLEAASPFTVSISDIRLATDPAGAVCPPAGET